MNNEILLYYGMKGADGLMTIMPIICDKEATHALVEFTSQSGIGNFDAFKEAASFKSLPDANEAAQKRKLSMFAIYTLQELSAKWSFL